MHHRKLRKLCITLFRTFSTSEQPVDAVVRPTFIWKLSYKLPGALKFTIIQTFDQNSVFFTEWCHVDRQCEALLSKFALFSVSGLKDWKVDKKQTYTKTEACRLYSRVFWIFCQMSSKSILIILSYTVSKFARFFLRHSVDGCILLCDIISSCQLTATSKIVNLFLAWVWLMQPARL